ncbi:MAG: hypothetical protein ABW208_13455, partial [Pyrinomonadaceae bacterium]
QAMDDADQELERGAQSVRDPVRGASADGRAQLKPTYTDRLEPPEQSQQPKNTFQNFGARQRRGNEISQRNIGCINAATKQ